MQNELVMTHFQHVHVNAVFTYFDDRIQFRQLFAIT